MEVGSWNQLTKPNQTKIQRPVKTEISKPQHELTNNAPFFFFFFFITPFHISIPHIPQESNKLIKSLKYASPIPSPESHSHSRSLFFFFFYFFNPHNIPKNPFPQTQTQTLQLISPNPMQGGGFEAIAGRHGSVHRERPQRPEAAMAEAESSAGGEVRRSEGVPLPIEAQHRLRRGPVP